MMMATGSNNFLKIVTAVFMSLCIGSTFSIKERKCRDTLHFWFNASINMSAIKCIKHAIINYGIDPDNPRSPLDLYLIQLSEHILPGQTKKPYDFCLDHAKQTNTDVKREHTACMEELSDFNGWIMSDILKHVVKFFDCEEKPIRNKYYNHISENCEEDGYAQIPRIYCQQFPKKSTIITKLKEFCTKS